MLKRFPRKDFYCSLFVYKEVCISCSSITGESLVIDNQGIIFPCSDRLDPETQSLGVIKNGSVKLERESFYKEEYNKLLETECGNCSFFPCVEADVFRVLREIKKENFFQKEKSSVIC